VQDQVAHLYKRTGKFMVLHKPALLTEIIHTMEKIYYNPGGAMQTILAFA
jgi:tRNA1(Val) A37 N6-methylase TrmN6